MRVPQPVWAFPRWRSRRWTRNAGRNGADPELIGRPRLAWTRVPQFHFVPATLTPDMSIHVGHGWILALPIADC